MAMPRERPPIRPLDAAALERMALRYVERFATTRGKLADYLTRKIRERGWSGDESDPVALAERMAELGYIDDRGFAEARAAAMARRGLGGRRVADALRAARVGEPDRQSVVPQVAERAYDAAIAFAKRRRIGPFGDGSGDRAVREKQVAAMLRAGHGFDLARRIVALPPGDVPPEDDFS
ncbi:MULTISPECIES: RecX family transcriptional regulator [unclassified Sphingomonas]|uniref:regulatory protein RecX n=1 Tax=unclassified Sphingomonas TaxID=196159 RepID=UPI001F5A7D75|nr:MULTISPECIES: RecX family transcriptional regulator [unclassified Sphingomonas]